MDWETSPLPLEASPEICQDAEVTRAYEVAVAFERDAISRSNGEHQTFSRVLGYLLREAPSQQIRQAIAADILRCRENHQGLAECGERYTIYFIGLFRKAKAYHATPSSSSRKFESLKETIKNEAVESTKPSERIRRDALQRDGYRCVATGRIDYASARKSMEVRQLEGRAAHTEAAHIIPQSLNRGIRNPESAKAGCKLDYHGNVFAILDLFGYSYLRTTLSGQAIHDLSNVMILSSDLHDFFDNLDLWFEPQEQADTYKVCMTWEKIRPPDLLDSITFTCAGPEELPLPSRIFLTLHAFCARVAHLSGAAGYIEKIYRDRDEMGVLAEDGSSAKVLEFLLLLQVGPAVPAMPHMLPESNLIPA